MAARVTPRGALKAFKALLFALVAGGFLFLCAQAAWGSTPRDRIRAALASLPVCAEDRDNPAKPAQLDAIAAAIDKHARDPRLAAFVAAWGWHETKFSMRIMSGRCRPLECDRGRARGFAQLHRNGLPAEEWDRLHGLENIDAQIAAATKRARGMLGMCGTAEGAYRALTGRGCSARLPDAARRVATYQQIRGRL